MFCNQDNVILFQNYGDESDAYGLMNPSIYSNLGVFEEDFFKSRDQGDIKRIFDSIGVEMTHKTFLELWNEAQKISSNGQVSYISLQYLLNMDNDVIVGNKELHLYALYLLGIFTFSMLQVYNNP